MKGDDHASHSFRSIQYSMLNNTGRVSKDFQSCVRRLDVLFALGWRLAWRVVFPCEVISCRVFKGVETANVQYQMVGFLIGTIYTC